MNPKALYSIVAVATAIAEEVARNLLRSNGQKKLQKRVNAESPAPIEKDLSVADDHIQLTILKDNHVDLEHCQELPMDKNEVNEWKSLISTLGGEIVKTALNTFAFSGLLKCDVPIKDLCRIKDNPEAMRGFIMSDGKISKHASFSEAGLGNVAPLLVYQCMAAVTSQYYQQIITERLNAIDAKLDNIIKIMEAEDHAKLKVSYKRFKELSKKSEYDIADKLIVSEFSGYVDIIREKYKELLSKSEVLAFIATTISIKVARYLGNDEDIKIYTERINLDYWDNYVDQFNRIRHDVIKYLELEAEASWVQSKSIVAMKNEQLKRFNDIEESMLEIQNQFNYIEESMLEIQNQFNYRTVQYIKIHEDGMLKKYICIDKS